MKTQILKSLLVFASLGTIGMVPGTAGAQGTAFTYQGRLNAHRAIGQRK